MTTIVANLEYMAADERVSVDGGPFYHADKIFRIGNSLFGTAGDGAMGLIVIDWLAKNPQRNRQVLYRNWPSDIERYACDILELNSTGLYLWNGWGIPEKLNDKRFAVGSGAMAALDAVDHGASLDDAIRRAAKYDQYTGAPIRIEPLKVKSSKRKR